MTLDIKEAFQFKINPEYQNLVPALEFKEYERIKNSIRKNGLKSKIYVNQDDEVLDGHNRIKMCRELGINLDFGNVEVITFENKLEEREFVILMNLDRRHLNEFQKIELGYELHKIESEKSRLRQLSQLNNVKASLAPNGANEKDQEEGNKSKKGKTSKIIADKIGVPVRTYERGIKVIEKGTEEQKQKCRRDQSTVYKECNKIETEEKDQKLRVDAHKYKSPKNSELFNADFREILRNIPDNSIGLVLTDPPYENTPENIKLYEDAGKLIIPKLREGHSFVFLVGGVIVNKIIIKYDKLEASGLRFWWEHAMLHNGSTAAVYEYGIEAKHKKFLGYIKTGGKEKLKPDNLLGLMPDLIKSEKPDKSLHKLRWNQSEIEARHFIEHLTVENDIVFDPFMGSGTFGIAALKLKRQFIGCEIDKETFETAEANIKNALGEEND